jgi:DNA (cytosine-5)-methyltransferase 1
MIKYFEFFSGIGAQARAANIINLKNKKEIFKNVGISEIDEEAILGYNTIHNKAKNYGDISNIKSKDLPNIDLLIYSFPCTDLSTAGGGEGIKEGTRSGLLKEVERILIEMSNDNKLPKYLLMENVKALLNKNHINDWKKYEKVLEGLGYYNTTMVLRGTDFGIPQARERVFCISKLNGNEDIKVEKENNCKKLFDFLGIDDLYNKFYKSYLDNYKLINKPYCNKIKDKNKNLDINSPYCMTLTTKQYRHPNAGVIKYNDNFRFITPEEQMLLMGFTKNDYKLLKDTNIKESTIERFAGNSIIVNKLVNIFEAILKDNR